MSLTDQKLLALAKARKHLTDYECELIRKGHYTFKVVNGVGVIEV